MAAISKLGNGHTIFIDVSPEEIKNCPAGEFIYLDHEKMAILRSIWNPTDKIKVIVHPKTDKIDKKLYTITDCVVHAGGEAQLFL